METVFGWVVEKINGQYFISAATKECKSGWWADTQKEKCHDISGFMGSWKASKGGVFFQTVSGDATCNIALEQAKKYVDENKGLV